MTENAKSSYENEGRSANTSQKSDKSRRKSAGAFLTISEVADELGVQQHVLRFWETKFAQVRPLKRGGGRRYYRPEDVDVLKRVHSLLYTEGYTIKGVQKLLKGHGKSQIINGEFVQNKLAAPAASMVPHKEAASKPANEESGQLSSRQRTILKSMLGELKELRDMIKDGEE